MNYQILNANGEVVNRIVADEEFVRAAYPNRWRLEATMDDVDPGGQQVVTVPYSIPSLNAHLMLISEGKLARLRDLVAQLDDVDRQEAEAYLTLAQTWRRDNKWVLQLGPALGYDSADLDRIFIAAAALNP